MKCALGAGDVASRYFKEICSDDNYERVGNKLNGVLSVIAAGLVLFAALPERVTVTEMFSYMEFQKEFFFMIIIIINICAITISCI